MNNHNNHLEVILIKNKGNKQLAAAFIIVLLCFLIAVKALSSVTTVIFKDEHNTVCIDPGHGGDAAGALSSDKKRFEKDDNLALSLKIKEKPKTYINEESAWNETIYDVLSICYYNTHDYKKSLLNVKKALKINPLNTRLQKNYEFIKKAV